MGYTEDMEGVLISLRKIAVELERNTAILKRHEFYGYGQVLHCATVDVNGALLSLEKWWTESQKLNKEFDKP